MALLVATLTHTSAAQASTVPGNYPGGDAYRGHYEFHVGGPASNGYSFAASGYRTRWTNKSATALALKRHRHPPLSGGKVATYTLERRPEHLSGDRVAFDLGERGSVDLRFEEQTRKVVRPNRCRGTLTLRRGIFRGAVRFHAENGYAEIPSPVRLRGHLDIDRTYNCYGSPPRKAHGPKPRPALVSCPDEGRFIFLAYDDASPHPIFYTSLSHPTRVAPGIYVDRYSYLRGGRFDYEPDLTSGIVRPPTPYHGGATFSTPVHGESGTLEGDLRLHLPGLAHATPLAPSPAVLERGYPPFACPEGLARGHGGAAVPASASLWSGRARMLAPRLTPEPPHSQAAGRLQT